MDDESRLPRPTPVGSAALVAVASVGFLALAWLPFATRISVEVALPPVAVETPVGETDLPSLFSPGPFIAGPAATPATVADWRVPAAGWGTNGGYALWRETGDEVPTLFRHVSLPPLRSPATTASAR